MNNFIKTVLSTAFFTLIPVIMVFQFTMTQLTINYNFYGKIISYVLIYFMYIIVRVVYRRFSNYYNKLNIKIDYKEYLIFGFVFTIVIVLLSNFWS